MTNLLVTTSQTLEPVLQRALQPEQLESHESVAEIISDFVTKEDIRASDFLEDGRRLAGSGAAAVRDRRHRR